MADFMSDETAMRIARDMCGHGGADAKAWSPREVVAALESLSFRVMRLEAGSVIPNLREQLLHAESENKHLRNIETDDAKKAGRASMIYFELEAIASAAVAGMAAAEMPIAVRDALVRISSIARAERLGSVPAPASAAAGQPALQLQEVRR